MPSPKKIKLRRRRASWLRCNWIRFYSDPYLRLAGIAQGEQNADEFAIAGRSFIALAPDHSKAAAVASAFGLTEKINGRWVTAEEDKQLQAYLKTWDNQELGEVAIFHAEESATDQKREATIEVSLTSAVMWHGKPHVRLILLSEGTRKYNARTYATTENLQMLVRNQATIGALSSSITYLNSSKGEQKLWRCSLTYDSGVWCKY